MIRLALIALIVTGTAHATTFSKGELKSMIAKKKYPKVINPREEASPVSFQYCSAWITDTLNEAEEDGYPSQVVTRKKNLIVAKVWRGSMMTMYTCKDGENLKTTDYDYAL